MREIKSESFSHARFYGGFSNGGDRGEVVRKIGSDKTIRFDAVWWLSLISGAKYEHVGE